MDRRNIAFFNIDYSMGGGVERVSSDLIDMFCEAGMHITHIYTAQKSNTVPMVDFKAELPVTIIGKLKKTEEISAFAKILKQHQIDILIYQADNMSISLAILAAAKEANIRAVGHYHGSPYAYLKKYPDGQKSNWLKICFSTLVYPFKKMKLKKFLKRSTGGVVFVSHAVRDEILDLFPGIDARLYAIVNPKSLVKETSGDNKKNVISFVSRLESRHKNAFLIMPTWRKIADKHPDWDLQILGTGSLESIMKSYATEHAIKNISFLGFQKDIHTHLESSKIAVSTSNCEGYPMSVLEYIVNNNAVVATRSDGGIHDMLVDGQTGIIVDRNDASQLSGAIEILIIDETMRLKLIHQAKTNLKDLYKEDTVSAWKNILN